VLLLGESGVGKSLIAREIHRCSRRAEKPFIEVNCAAIPETLVESELFGVERGAYSGAATSRAGRFEVAQGGTLFLDEIATLSMVAQGKLLRVLQNGEMERLGSNRTITVDARVIAATNENLEMAVREGRFREDLFFRLNVFPLNVVPLRERRDDIPLLVDVLLARFCARHGRALTGVSSRAMRSIIRYRWPGNIRELENILERAIILAQDGETLDRIT
jgi:transcriptional regulator with GAF, ATPase, and Fis domain